MRRQIEGSQAVAIAVAQCRPQVVCAYPISPQTHIVETVSRMVRTGELEGCQYVNVESEFAAMSGVIGASAVGARTWTATSSQGLLFMVEAVYNASGMALPIVMTVANRAIGAPINIWNDHSDSMSQRDSGWIQVHAADNQDAVDLHVLALRIAETLYVPVMVCMDGFVLTHAFEPVELPEQAQVDAFLPPFRPRQRLTPDDPVSMGAMVGPEAFTEVRVLAHERMRAAVEILPGLAAEWGGLVGREIGTAVRPYRMDGATTAVLALGSVVGTLQDVVDLVRDGGDDGDDGKSQPGEGTPGETVGLIGLTLFRPFPAAEVRAALEGVRRVVVVERAFAPGAGGIVSQDVREALVGTGIEVQTVVAGLGGRPVTVASLRRMVGEALAGELPAMSFLDLRQDVVDTELAVWRAGFVHAGRDLPSLQEQEVAR